MKLSDKTLMNLLAPLFEKEVEAYGLEKLTIEGKLDQSGDDAIYVDVWVKSNEYNHQELFSKLNNVIDTALEEKDERQFHYIHLHSPPLSKELLQAKINAIGFNQNFNEDFFRKLLVH